MNLFYLIIFFLFGLFFGSFFTVVGLRLPRGENFITNHSYCDHCHHELSMWDMVPLLSFLFLRGKCRYCGKKIPDLSTYMEFFTGVLFALSYYAFGFSSELWIALGIVSMLIILSVSDISYMIIPDEVLIFFAGYFLIIIAITSGVLPALLSIIYGLLLFAIMYGIMLLGNFLFRKETLGGGDIKMMFVVGIVLNPIMGLVSIFLGSLLALPVAILFLLKKHQNLIPFGPFLLISFAILYFTQIDFEMIIDFFRLF